MQVYKFLKNKKSKNFNLNNLIINLKYNDENIVTSITVDYNRKDNIYHKNQYIILTNYMKINLKNKNIQQYFTDVTYYITPTSSKN